MRSKYMFKDNQNNNQMFFVMSNLQTHYHFKVDFPNVDQYIRSKWSVHGTKSPVKKWKDLPQIATKTKEPTSCRRFCVDFKHEKFTKINRVEPFQIPYYL